MTDKQKRFCLEYSTNGNATQSAIKAGYSEKTAYSAGQRLLKDVEVKQLLQTLAEQNASEKIANAKEIQEVLTSIIRQESTEEVLMVEGIGDGCSEVVKKTKTASQADRIKAMQLLARMQGVLDSGNTVNIVVPVFGGESDLAD